MIDWWLGLTVANAAFKMRILVQCSVSPLKDSLTASTYTETDVYVLIMDVSLHVALHNLYSIISISFNYPKRQGKAANYPVERLEPPNVTFLFEKWKFSSILKLVALFPTINSLINPLIATTKSPWHCMNIDVPLLGRQLALDLYCGDTVCDTTTFFSCCCFQYSVTTCLTFLHHIFYVLCCFASVFDTCPKVTSQTNC